MVNIKQKIEDGWIQCRIVIEVMGRPVEYVDGAIRKILDKIKEEKDFEVISGKLAKPKKQETGAQEDGLIKEMWVTFAEVELLFKDLTAITYFCFEYMPSSIEILEPQSFESKAITMSEFFNDLQSRLHEVNLIAKQLRSKNLFLDKNIGGLLNNFVTILLHNSEMTAEQIAKLTGIKQETVEDFLDKMIDENKVEMIGEKYRRVLDGGKEQS